LGRTSILGLIRSLMESVANAKKGILVANEDEFGDEFGVC
jgi:hypothetical protein